jgi:hypothetical protein
MVKSILFSIVGLVLVGCYADNGVNPSEQYQDKQFINRTVEVFKKWPECNSQREGQVALYDRRSHGGFKNDIYVCADHAWVYLRSQQ